MAHTLNGTVPGLVLLKEPVEDVLPKKPAYRVTRQARMPRSGTIVIADYDRDNVSVLSYALKGASVKNPVHWLQDGDAVVDYLSQGKDGDAHQMPLLLLMDWNMPPGNAMDILRWVRQQPEYLDLLVAVVTNSNDPAQKRLAYESGANWHFVKSADFVDLMRLVRHIREFWSYAVEPGFYEQLAAR